MKARPLVTRWEEFVRRRALVADGVLALVLFAVTVTAGVATSTHPNDGSQWVWGAVLGGVGSLALLFHRLHPRGTVVVTAVCAAVATSLGFLLTPLVLGQLMASLYWFARDRDRHEAFRWAAGVALLLVAVSLLEDTANYSFVLQTVNPVAWLLLMPYMGGAVQLRRAYLEAVEARAVFAERTREEEARHRVDEERIRIARDLHDVVAHHMTLANAQAGTAAYLARRNPDPRVSRVLDELVGTTSSALRELKATVAVLREAGDTDSPLEPAPGLEDLPALAESFTPTGLRVTLREEGRPLPVSSGVGLTAYRIVQEALTNAAKHARTDAAVVTLRYGRDRIVVTVTDDGPAGASEAPVTPEAPAGAPSGFGLLGMHERAQLVGGTLTAGRRGTGFSVVAELPLLPGELTANDPSPEQEPTT
ncbi:sensor histidine kinase [Streptomyces sp. NBC_00102]|uniref:sensor histidine kinase n=1 Tax=Streptomyces sp. NBC_00102 TaxID=2975652 RepID=UPI00225AB23A|nr:sensor histidine kinase [Streptomyces sp. NBC_00102]MCX5401385.1 sensor histidine kinase [Streptomyces sp. NBC_00102]